MASEDGIAYVYENIGPTPSPNDEGIAYVYESIVVAQPRRRSAGVLVTQGRNNRQGVGYVYENIT